MTNLKAYIFGMIFHTNFWFDEIDYWLGQLILGKFKGGNFPKFVIFLWRWLDIHIFLLLAWNFSILYFKHLSTIPQKTFQIIFFFIMAECDSSKDHLVSSLDSFITKLFCNISSERVYIDKRDDRLNFLKSLWKRISLSFPGFRSKKGPQWTWLCRIFG